ncbi:MAG: tRNA lysidine(34) synthetase TilS [Butyrivibrio sp.]|nr:tRNA lysidine(34) synthetase TilS [Acetatifactor muris]MCM1559957.1 tRNA lysidine(34) synthetase TilS [Butyrivibrio sp.]
MIKQAEEKVFSFVEKHEMIRPGDRIVLGVSGGADSVCLLFLLQEYRRKVPFEMLAVHVNHGIRGKAAEEDAAWVEALCREQGLAFRLECADVKGFAVREKCSEEDAGRRLRYEAFRKAAGEFGGTKIAVAHNAGDRAETMLLHLFRGSGLKGLRGIEPVREDENRRIDTVCPTGKSRPVSIIRPVLCLERREIEEYLQERQLPWRADATNEGDGYTRNRIRHHLLPWAEQNVSGRVVSHMCNTADILSEAEEYLRQQTLEALERCVFRVSGRKREEAEIDIAGFLACHPVLQKRMLLALAEELSPTGKDISAVHVEEVLSLFEKEGNRSICLPFGICFRRRYGKVLAGRQETADRPGQAEQAGRMGQTGHSEQAEPSGELPELELTEIFVKVGEEVPENQYTKRFDCDKIKESPVLRFRQTGDYLTLPDGKGNMIHKSLKDYMIDRKIPREMRDRIPVLAEGSHVLWLIGYRSSEYYKTDRNTKRILQVKLKGNC